MILLTVLRSAIQMLLICHQPLFLYQQAFYRLVRAIWPSDLAASFLKVLLMIFRFEVIRHRQKYYPPGWVSICLTSSILRILLPGPGRTGSSAGCTDLYR